MYHLIVLIERGFSLIKRKFTDFKTRFFPDKSGKIKTQLSENHSDLSELKSVFQICSISENPRSILLYSLNKIRHYLLSIT